MADLDSLSQNVIQQQARMFRLAERDHGLTRRVLHLETGIPIATLKSWNDGTAMPAYGLVKLSRVVPDELTSLLFEPAGKFVGTCGTSDGDPAQLATESATYNVEYLRATDPRSDGGAAITPRERARLADLARPMTCTAQRVARA